MNQLPYAPHKMLLLNQSDVPFKTKLLNKNCSKIQVPNFLPVLLLQNNFHNVAVEPNIEVIVS